MGGLGSCSAVATCEGPADGENCAADGSSNYVKRDLKWDAVMGIMKGTVTSNRCADHPYGVAAGDPGRQQRYHTAACTEQTFPDANFAAGAAAAPLRGTVGLSLSGGCNIYGPFEAGFTDGQVCAGGSCPAGLDVPVCENKLALECSTKAEELGMMLDDCAGHAMPYVLQRRAVPHTRLTRHIFLQVPLQRGPGLQLRRAGFGAPLARDRAGAGRETAAREVGGRRAPRERRGPRCLQRTLRHGPGERGPRRHLRLRVSYSQLLSRGASQLTD